MSYIKFNTNDDTKKQVISNVIYSIATDYDSNGKPTQYSSVPVCKLQIKKGNAEPQVIWTKPVTIQTKECSAPVNSIALPERSDGFVTSEIIEYRNGGDPYFKIGNDEITIDVVKTSATDPDVGRYLYYYTWYENVSLNNKLDSAWDTGIYTRCLTNSGSIGLSGSFSERKYTLSFGRDTQLYNYKRSSAGDYVATPYTFGKNLHYSQAVKLSRADQSVTIYDQAGNILDTLTIPKTPERLYSFDKFTVNGNDVADNYGGNLADLKIPPSTDIIAVNAVGKLTWKKIIGNSDSGYVSGTNLTALSKSDIADAGGSSYDSHTWSTLTFENIVLPLFSGFDTTKPLYVTLKATSVGNALLATSKGIYGYNSSYSSERVSYAEQNIEKLRSKTILGSTYVSSWFCARVSSFTQRSITISYSLKKYLSSTGSLTSLNKFNLEIVNVYQPS